MGPTVYEELGSSGPSTNRELDLTNHWWRMAHTFRASKSFFKRKKALESWLRAKGIDLSEQKVWKMYVMKKKGRSQLTVRAKCIDLLWIFGLNTVGEESFITFARWCHFSKGKNRWRALTVSFSWFEKWPQRAKFMRESSRVLHEYIIIKYSIIVQYSTV